MGGVRYAGWMKNFPHDEEVSQLFVKVDGTAFITGSFGVTFYIDKEMMHFTNVQFEKKRNRRVNEFDKLPE